MHRNWLILSICFVLIGLSVNRVEAVESVVYKVKKGDTLWEIAQKFGTNVEQLKKLNGLQGHLIYPEDRLILPGSTKKAPAYTKKGVAVSKKDFNWLVKIIEAEAGGESFEGKVAVGSVVLNRVINNAYPDTITSVIFQKVKGVYQFSPVADGRIYKVVPTDDSYRAAKVALKGVDPTSGALFFYNPETARGSWIRSRVVVTEIGRHHFAY